MSPLPPNRTDYRRPPSITPGPPGTASANAWAPPRCRWRSHPRSTCRSASWRPPGLRRPTPSPAPPPAMTDAILDVGAVLAGAGAPAPRQAVAALEELDADLARLRAQVADRRAIVIAA